VYGSKSANNSCEIGGWVRGMRCGSRHKRTTSSKWTVAGGAEEEVGSEKETQGGGIGELRQLKR
jgi:hypothetical protein